MNEMTPETLRELGELCFPYHGFAYGQVVAAASAWEADIAKRELLQEKLDGLLLEGRYVLANKKLGDDLRETHARLREALARIEALERVLRSAQNRIGHGAACNHHTECREIRAALAAKPPSLPSSEES